LASPDFFISNSFLHSEIDVFEGVNLVTNNQMGLHTLPGCMTPGGNQVNTSQTASTDCSYLANSNEGCKVVDGNTNSYGEAFANAGGGVFVTEFAESGISCVTLFFICSNIDGCAGYGSLLVRVSLRASRLMLALLTHQHLGHQLPTGLQPHALRANSSSLKI